MRNHLVINGRCEYFCKSDDTYKLVLDLIKVVDGSYS